MLVRLLLWLLLLLSSLLDVPVCLLLSFSPDEVHFLWFLCCNRNSLVPKAGAGPRVGRLGPLGGPKCSLLDTGGGGQSLPVHCGQLITVMRRWSVSLKATDVTKVTGSSAGPTSSGPSCYVWSFWPGGDVTNDIQSFYDIMRNEVTFLPVSKD